MACPIARIYPLKKPLNHRLPIRRWQLAFPHGTTQTFTAYIGLQQHSNNESASLALSQATKNILNWLGTENGPAAHETFDFIDGNDVTNARIWVCYWLDPSKYTRSLERLSLPSLHGELPAAARGSIGFWLESFATATSRLETNYSGLDYLPGLARIPGTSTEEHSFSAYWGAARDRIPDSGWDLFSQAEDVVPPTSCPVGIGQYLTGTNYQNLVHIRSGQFWENCDGEEVASYEEKLEPTLQTGLEYLWDHPVESGTVGLRYLRNAHEAFSQGGQKEKKESCGAGFFTSLESLEKWAKTHPSHLAIYRGAMAHFKKFGDERKFRTWHEVSVLKEGEARFEYLNCAPGTGVMSSIRLEVKSTL